ncbi:MAG: NADP-dependent phosphogluconate dehydrogenase [bacterium]|nr:NADP-dependent phosphogluconate dehydrogenase [bacterium]
MHKQLGFIGLGKMGRPMVQRLRQKGWKVETYDIQARGTVSSISELTLNLLSPRIVFLMVPAGKPVDQVLSGLLHVLKRGDVVIDGGNSFFEDSMRRAARLKKKGIHYLDTGISGGPVSIKQGRFAIMAGGEKRVYEKIKPLFRALSDTRSGYMGKSGAGHFAKMIHNGIEYGMMQALAEGFTVLKKAPFKFRLYDVVDVYSQNSIITSRLVNWLREGFEKYGEDLQKASGSVSHTGEGEWTVKTAKKLKVTIPIIKGAFDFRVRSEKNPSFTGRILSTLRAVFGGHKI